MAVQFDRWVQARGDSGGATPGARALLAGVLEVFGDRGARSLGIYVPRKIKNRETVSCHSEGRAVDVGFPVLDGQANPAGWDLVRALLRVGPRRLGIQAMIFDRTIWSAKSPEGREYKGASPHIDHVHVELSPAGARDLSLATVRTALASAASGGPGDDGLLKKLREITDGVVDVVEVLMSMSEERQLVRVLAQRGVRDDGKLTDCVFYCRHPERVGRPLDPADPADAQLIDEWQAIRRMVRLEMGDA